MMEVDIDFLEHYDARSKRWPTAAVLRMAQFLMWAGGRTQVEIENLWLPDRPVIYATNHTHNLDFLPLWIELLRLDEEMVGWVKARIYKKWIPRVMMRVLGNNAPLVSRGYLIAADFRQLLDRPPTDGEYRKLRDHVDGRAPMPRGAVFGRIDKTPREILGRRYEPETEEYGEAMRDLFYRMMCETVETTRSAVEAGHHLHIHPEGQVTRHMTRGHTGVVHAALALDLPVVPVGVSGADEVFVGNGPLTRGGTVRLQFGAPFFVDPGIVASTFRPFHPADSAAHDEALQAEVDRLMMRLEGLVDEGYGYSRQAGSEGLQGVARFY